MKWKGCFNKKREEIFKKAEYKCSMCGIEVWSFQRRVKEPQEWEDFLISHDWWQPVKYYASIDHIIPRVAGGLDEPSNLRCVCFRCNASKNGRLENGSDKR
jgi:5-methylcytosine-specific restriction endonuclease McrA